MVKHGENFFQIIGQISQIGQIGQIEITMTERINLDFKRAIIPLVSLRKGSFMIAELFITKKVRMFFV